MYVVEVEIRNAFLSDEVIVICGATARSYICTTSKISRYGHLNELLKDRTGYVYPRVHEDNNYCNAFVGLFINNALMEDPNIIVPVDVLRTNLRNRFRLTHTRYTGFYGVLRR